MADNRSRLAQYLTTITTPYERIDMAVHLRIITLVLALTVFTLALVWLVSTEEQRLKYMIWLGLAEPHIDSEPRQIAPVITINKPYSPYARHGAVKRYQCAPKTRAVTDIEKKAQVYKWTDNEGRVHFSDRAPETSQTKAQIEDLSQKYQNKAQYFRVNIEVLGNNVPAWTQDRLASSTRQIFTILSDQLNIEDLRQIDLNVKVFDNRQAYQNYAFRIAPNISQWSAGFYNYGLNTAAVHHDGRDEVTHQVARHESTHVIMAGLFGQIPIWLTEGMAEYFEHLKVSGQGKTIYPDQQQMALLRSRALPHLSDWFSQTGGWYRDGQRDFNYAVAWSLIHFLMQEEWRRRLLGGYMQALSKNVCQPVSGVEYFSRHYPGGMRQMTRDWQAWVKSGQARRHYF